MDFRNTKINFGRPITSYAKVQAALTRLLRNRTMFFKPVPDGEFYVNIGCGPKARSSFYNIDFDWHPGVDRCVDITRSLDLPKGRVSGAYSEHCIEHIEAEDAASVFRKLHDAMIPGSVFRFIVPDGGLYCRLYVESMKSGENLMPHGDEVTYAGVSGAIMNINSVMRNHGHRFIYDFQTAERFLKKAGFQECHQVKFGEGRNPDLILDSPERAVESIYIEAIA